MGNLLYALRRNFDMKKNLYIIVVILSPIVLRTFFYLFNYNDSEIYLRPSILIPAILGAIIGAFLVSFSLELFETSQYLPEYPDQYHLLFIIINTLIQVFFPCVQFMNIILFVLSIISALFVIFLLLCAICFNYVTKKKKK